MMKSFFKKLAFVMALAMVVSMVAPAGAVFAATEGISINKVVYETYALEVDEAVDFAFEGYVGYKKGVTSVKWTSSDETVASVDKAGIVTGLKDGVATITVTVGGTWVKTMDVTVGAGAAEEEKPVVSGAFTAKQTTHTYAEVTFENKDITAEAVAGALNVYWYVTEDYRATQPYQVISVEDGVALINVYGFNDGLVYEFEFGEYTDSFTAHIGEVASIDIMVYPVADESIAGYAYANKDAYIKYTLKNQYGIDITGVALSGNTGAYVEYSLTNESNTGEFWLNDTTGTADSPEGKIYFTTAGSKAEVRAKYITGKYDETTGAPVEGPVSNKLTVVATNAPSYRFTATLGASVMNTAQVGSAYDFDTKATTTIALEDEVAVAKKIVFKLKDSEKTTVYSDATTNQYGTFSFKSTDNGIVFVDPKNGNLTTNSTGSVSVLVYFTYLQTAANSNPQPFLVGVTPLNVQPKRAISSINIPSTNLTNVVSSESSADKFNEREFTVEIKDQLGDLISGGAIGTSFKVERNNSKLPEGVNPPSVVPSPGSKTGEYKITITGAANCLPEGSTSYPFTYIITCGNAPAKQFTVTVRTPIYSTAGDPSTLVVSGYDVVITGDKDIKTSADDEAMEKEFAFTLNAQSNAVNVKKQPVYKKVKDMTYYAGNFYYSVSKDGKDITENGTTLVGGTAATGTAVKVSLTDLATDSAVDGNYVVKNNKSGAGTYVVTVYKAVGATNGDTTQALSIVQTRQHIVTNTQKTVSYTGVKTAATIAITQATSVDKILTSCFQFTEPVNGKFGGTATSTLPTNVKMKVAANVPGNDISVEDVIYIKYVDFYLQNGVAGDGKLVYTVNRVYINDYVTVK